jgi:uncharacterized protein (DUF885 family)
LPFFRRLVPFSAYAEGWGLYAERLAWELGFQQDPYDNIGRLLRDLAQTELGDRFDIRDFHNVVLTNGSVPLGILEELVRQYIADKNS